MEVKRVVVLEPQWQLGDDRFGVRDGIDRDVITLERFDEGFCHSVGLRAADRRRARLHSDVHQQRFRVLCNETRAVVGELFNRLGKGVGATAALLDGCDDKVLNVFALDALSGGDMGDGFTITAVEGKGNAELSLCCRSQFQSRHNTSAGSSAPRQPGRHGDGFRWLLSGVEEAGPAPSSPDRRV